MGPRVRLDGIYFWGGGVLFTLSALLRHDFPGFAFILYCTTHISMSPAGFEHATPASDRPQTLAIDLSATGIGWIRFPDRPARSESL